MDWITHENQDAVDRMLSQMNPAVTLRLKVLGAEPSTVLLHYEIAEQTRYCVDIWEMAQITVGAGFFFFLLFGTSEDKISLALSLVLLILVLAQHWIVTPEVNGLGRLLDFVAPSAMAGERAKLQVMQYTYLGMEAGKAVLQLALMSVLVGRGRVRGGAAALGPVQVQSRSKRQAI